MIGKIPKLSMKLIVKLGPLSINDDTLKDTVERDNVLTRKRIRVDYFHACHSRPALVAGTMTTTWRPDLERIRAEIAAKAEVEVKEEANEEDGVKQGAKRKRAPHTKGPCEHGVKYRSQCKVCSACPHGRRRSQCKECGGASICEHGRVRSMCKECGGGSFCEHGRVRSQCKECIAAKTLVT